MDLGTRYSRASRAGIRRRRGSVLDPERIQAQSPAMPSSFSVLPVLELIQALAQLFLAAFETLDLFAQSVQFARLSRCDGSGLSPNPVRRGLDHSFDPTPRLLLSHLIEQGQRRGSQRTKLG